MSIFIILGESVNRIKKVLLNVANVTHNYLSTEVNICTKLSLDEEIVQFRSSPNFKNMKKFLKSRNDLETASLASCSMSPDYKPQQKAERKGEIKPDQKPPQKVERKVDVKPDKKPLQKVERKVEIKPVQKPLQKVERKVEIKPDQKPLQKVERKVEIKPDQKPLQKVERKVEIKPDQKPLQKVERKGEIKPAVVQPPLPPYPPPPDSPPALKIVIKQEKVDDVPENPIINGDGNPEALNQEQPPPEAEQNDERPKKTICKEFVRGNCKRPVCKFAHEVDVSQLAGIFTFCWNYQNAVCTYPNCRFVHASVFEEAEFYRTGSLPPHARSHFKKPPPASAAEEAQPESLPNFSNPPPTLHQDVENAMPVMSCVPASNLESRPPEEEFRVPVPRSTSPLKRDWNNSDEFSSSPRDIEPNDHLAKKCKNCEITEFRLQYNKSKVRSMIQSTEEINKKLSQLNKKSNKLCTVLLTLMKPPPAKPEITNGLSINGDKEKSILEKLNLVNSRNILSSIGNEDNVRNTLLGTQHNISLSDLMKLFCSTGDQALSPETSRET